MEKVRFSSAKTVAGAPKLTLPYPMARSSVLQSRKKTAPLSRYSLRSGRSKIKNGCHTPHITEETLKTASHRAWAALLADKDRYIKEYETVLSILSDADPFDKQTAMLTAECTGAAALVEDCIAANAASALNQAEYQKRYNELVERYDTAKTQLDALKQDKLRRTARKEKICRFLEILRKADQALLVFDERLWRETVELMTVHSLEDITVKFHSGTEIHVSTKDE